MHNALKFLICILIWQFWKRQRAIRLISFRYIFYSIFFIKFLLYFISYMFRLNIHFDLCPIRIKKTIGGHMHIFKTRHGWAIWHSWPNFSEELVRLAKVHLSLMDCRLHYSSLMISTQRNIIFWHYFHILQLC